MDLILILIVAAAAIGFIVGLVKGFTNVKAWANDVVLTALCVILIMNALNKNTPDWMKIYINGGYDVTNYVITLVLCVLFILLFSFISFRAKRFFEKGIEKRKFKSYYEQYEDREDAEDEMIDALSFKDEKRFNSLSKANFQESEGAIGVLNKFCGAFTLAIKGAVIAFWAISAVLILLDLAHLDSVGFISSLLQSNTWVALKAYAFDFLIVALISLCISCGYKSGIFTFLWSIVIIVLVVLAGYMSYYLAFNVEEFIQLSEGLAVNIEEMVAPVTSYGVSVDLIAKILVAAFIFIFALVIVILIGIFVPKILKNARESAIFSTIDGILGAIVALALMLALITVMGKVLYDLRVLDIMSKLNTYFDNSVISDVFYNDNILNALIQTNLINWFIPQ